MNAAVARIRDDQIAGLGSGSSVQETRLALTLVANRMWRVIRTIEEQESAVQLVRHYEPSIRQKRRA